MPGQEIFQLATAQEMISALQSALLDPGPAGRAMLAQLLREGKVPTCLASSRKPFTGG